MPQNPTHYVQIMLHIIQHYYYSAHISILLSYLTLKRVQNP